MPTFIHEPTGKIIEWVPVSAVEAKTTNWQAGGFCRFCLEKPKGNHFGVIIDGYCSYACEGSIAHIEHVTRANEARRIAQGLPARPVKEELLPISEDEPIEAMAEVVVENKETEKHKKRLVFTDYPMACDSGFNEGTKQDMVFGILAANPGITLAGLQEEVAVYTGIHSDMSVMAYVSKWLNHPEGGWTVVKDHLVSRGAPKKGAPKITLYECKLAVVMDGEEPPSWAI